jgi:hypothetical protein
LKDEGSNFNAITIALKSIVSCEILGLEESFQGTCFGHVFFYACQHQVRQKNSSMFLLSLINHICKIV